MGSGAFVVACLASAIGSLILMFPLAALAVRGHRKLKLGWGKGFALFGITILVVAILNFAFFSAKPALLNSSEMSLLSSVQMFLVPLAVSLAVLYVLWRPKAPDHFIQAEPASLLGSNGSLLHCNNSPISTLRVGLIQALGRTKRCNMFGTIGAFLFHRFVRFLARGVGFLCGLAGLLCSCVAPALCESNAWRLRRRDCSY